MVGRWEGMFVDGVCLLGWSSRKGVRVIEGLVLDDIVLAGNTVWRQYV